MNTNLVTLGLKDVFKIRTDRPLAVGTSDRKNRNIKLDVHFLNHLIHSFQSHIYGLGMKMLNEREPLF